MKILVVDVAAESGGALTILKKFYEDFVGIKSNEYFVCVSEVDLATSGNVKVLRFPWVKKSWLHRLWFDFIVAHRLIKQYDVDEVFSLQNVLVPFARIPQKLYLHQPLPFTDFRFKLRKDPLFWVYQKIIGPVIFWSVRKAHTVIVQTEWFKKEVMHRCGVTEEKITVTPPSLNMQSTTAFDQASWGRSFFYPSSSLSYKNHITLLRAMELLKDRGIEDYRVYLTLKLEELPKQAQSLANKLHDSLVLMGSIDHESVMKMYSENVLVFPSYIETYGLPLLEAKMCEAPIIASDRPYSREILSDYSKAVFFPAMDYLELANQMSTALGY